MGGGLPTWHTLRYTAANLWVLASAEAGVQMGQQKNQFCRSVVSKSPTVISNVFIQLVQQHEANGHEPAGRLHLTASTGRRGLVVLQNSFSDIVCAWTLRCIHAGIAASASSSAQGPGGEFTAHLLSGVLFAFRVQPFSLARRRAFVRNKILKPW